MLNSGQLLGWSWAQSDPDGPQIEEMHMEVQVTSKVANLGTFGDSFTPRWAQRRHSMRNIASNEASSIEKKCENTSENKRFEDFGLGPLCLPFWSDMDYGLRSWAKVTALLAEAGPKWSRCCGHIGSKRCIWTILYGGAKRANYHGENLLFGARSILKMPAPSWSCTSEQKIVRIDRLFGAGNFCVACVADRTSADRNSSRKRSTWFWNKTAGPRSATSFMWNVTKRKGLPQLVKMKHFCPGVLGAALFWICGLDEKRKPWNLVWLCHVQHKDLK